MQKSAVWTSGIFLTVILLASLVPVTSSAWANEGDPGGPLPGAKGTGGLDLGTIIVQFDAEQTAKVVSKLDKVALIVSKGTGITASIPSHPVQVRA